MRLKSILVSCITATGIFIGGSITAIAETVDQNSIVDYLRQMGKDFSFEARSIMALEIGIENYSGTAEQNTELLSTLKGNASESSVAAPQEDVETSGNKTITMTATAYTAYCNGCSGVTATGIDLRSNPNQKVIAVDPKVIPLGSRVYVEGYGEAIAGDVGGAIKGNRIDLFIPSKSSALDWGRRTVNVTILN